MNIDEQTDARLRAIARKASPGPSIVDEVMKAIESDRALAAGELPQFTSSRRARFRLLRWLIPAGIAAVVALVFVNFPGAEPKAIAWADVVQQFRIAQSVRLDVQFFKDGKLTKTTRCFLRAPDMAWCESFGPDGKTPGDDNSFVAGHKSTSWNPKTRLYWTDNSPNNGTQSNPVWLYLAMLELPGLERPAQIQGIEFYLEPRDPFEWKSQSYLQFAVMMKQQGQTAAAGPTLCLDRKTREVRFFNMMMNNEQGIGSVTFNPKIPNDVFRIPEGYTDVTAGIWPTLSPQVRPVAEAYEAARKNQDNYRALIWYENCADPTIFGGGNAAHYRIVRQQERLRMDKFYPSREISMEFLPKTFVFEDLWRRVWDIPIETEALVTNGSLATIIYNGEPAPRFAGWNWRSGQFDRRLATFAALGRPSWMDLENKLPMGWDIRKPRLKYELLPRDPKHPEWIGVRGERPLDCMYEYWLDPKRSYLCVRQIEGEYARSQKTDKTPHLNAQVWEITEAMQTADGRWFPKRIRYQLATRGANGELELKGEGDCIRVEVVPYASVDPHFFDWPDGAPRLDPQ